jgi:hypothetical protein
MCHIILKLLRIPVSVIKTYTIIDLFCRKLYIFRVVAAVLHAENIYFTKGTIDGSYVIKDDKSRFHLNIAGQRVHFLLSKDILYLLFPAFSV